MIIVVNLVGQIMSFVYLKMKPCRTALCRILLDRSEFGGSKATFLSVLSADSSRRFVGETKEKTSSAVSKRVRHLNSMQNIAKTKIQFDHNIADQQYSMQNIVKSQMYYGLAI